MADTPAFLSAVEWTANEGTKREHPDVPVATHHGVLDIAGVKLNCYRLDDGRAIVDADDFARLMEEWGMSGIGKDGAAR